MAIVRKNRPGNKTMFSQVVSLDMNKKGKVESFLTTQFTVNYEDGTFGFLFYKDKGVTWRPLDEQKRRPKSKTDTFFKQFIDESTPDVTVSWLESLDNGEGIL